MEESKCEIENGRNEECDGVNIEKWREGLKGWKKGRVGHGWKEMG